LRYTPWGDAASRTPPGGSQPPVLTIATTPLTVRVSNPARFPYQREQHNRRLTVTEQRGSQLATYLVVLLPTTKGRKLSTYLLVV